MTGTDWEVLGALGALALLLAALVLIADDLRRDLACRVREDRRRP